MQEEFNLKELRFLAKRKFSKANKMFFYSRKQLEQATPEIVAFYRAKRLKCNTAIDACCGIGMDAIALAKNCKKVYAIDESIEAIEAAKRNAEAYKVKNIEFIHANVFSLDFSEFNAEIVFADPSRRINGKRVKGFDKTSPSTTALINKCFQEGIKGFCIEASRQFNVEEIPFKCEKEFISLENELNCVSLYFGFLKECNVSAVRLPEEERLSTNRNEILLPKSHALLSFLFELNECISKSRLYFELLEKLDNKASFFNEGFLTSNSLIESVFFVNSFKVLKQLEKPSIDDLLFALNEFNAAKIVLRGSFENEKKFALLKEKLEPLLYGKEKLHLFLFDNNALICKNIKI